MLATKRKHRTEPLAVLISDIHFSLSTIDVASIALKDALGTAEKLKVPLILCGDTNDTKAIIRAEVANALIDCLKAAEVPVYILVGNHDLINEKGKEHGLKYLAPYAHIISEPTEVMVDHHPVFMVPYQSTPEAFTEAMRNFKGGIVIMHQGVNGAFMGDYIQDKSAIMPDFEGTKVFSGHYHRHQTVGDVTYIGNPYSLSFGEANDGPKGYLVINADGSYKQNVLNLRKHHIIDVPAYELKTIVDHRDQLSQFSKYKDIPLGSPIRLRVTGVHKSDMKFFTKPLVGLALFGHENFNMELVEKESSTTLDKIPDYSGKEGNEKLFDTLIDVLDIDVTLKASLKVTWRKLAS